MQKGGFSRTQVELGLTRCTYLWEKRLSFLSFSLPCSCFNHVSVHQLFLFLVTHGGKRLSSHWNQPQIPEDRILLAPFGSGVPPLSQSTVWCQAVWGDAVKELSAACSWVLTEGSELLLCSQLGLFLLSTVLWTFARLGCLLRGRPSSVLMLSTEGQSLFSPLLGHLVCP